MKNMAPASFPWIIALIASSASILAVRGRPRPFGQGIALPAFVVFLIVFTLLRTIFVLDMEQIFTGIVGGGGGGLVLGLMVAAGKYLDGDAARECWTICMAITGVFALVGLTAGAIMII